MKRQTLFALIIPIILGAFLVASTAATAATDAPIPTGGTTFDYAWLKGRARALAATPHVNHEGELPKVLQNLTWDDYMQLSFDSEHALWQGESSLFHAELFHLGLYFKTPITIYELQDGKVKEIDYTPDLFKYGKSGIKGKDLPKDLGFAGFRFRFHTDWNRDLVAFLGASYFRAVGGEMQYGLSARGLAVDTALPRNEEFPLFTHFWLEKPRPGSDTATVYALLDSPSVTGAYRFDIRPGQTLGMKVDAALYPRKTIERLGVAPLTSMFLTGENDRRMGYDWRQEIHDSDGLAIHTGNGEWIWRPLENPPFLRFNAFMDRNPRGFGLFQRDQNFDHYQDDGVFYDKRPSVWVEPVGDWGEGSVQLVEISHVDETFDNIVAFWNPAAPVEAGQELLFSYNLHWGTQPPMPGQLAHVVDTFTGLGGVVGQKRVYYSKRFAVDFTGGDLAMIAKDKKITPVLETSAGRIELTSVRPQHAINGFRCMFDVVPPDESQNPINLRLHLEADGRRISETWVYQMTPPPMQERTLYNP
ncbi:glucans biosynthesis protein [Desulfomicrobium apsheronum]|uniref:Glucans biosynthesis protein n=1 Tax=Desulfomicrobium apsheronum TaxID=52560 RepID=A0A1I3ZBB8_9BACT|nr:glucan biosynthesis protein D [Desulfomicrobium apsheronum]SFK41394.1 glucans biosynthesis protein [Desulfomicrobium apsheronum]